MGRNKRITFVIKLAVIVVILSVVLSVGYIYRENIYNFLSKKSSDEDTHEVLNSNTVFVTEAVSDIPDISETQQFTEKIIEQTDGELAKVGAQGGEAEETTEPTIIETTTAESTTQPETLPPVVTSPPPPPTTEYTEYIEPTEHIIEIPDPDFIQAMFAGAVEIPDSDGKIELPPVGRSMEQQYGAVPLSENIPEPSEYFKNALFLGDSVTTGFDLYRNSIKFNGEPVVKDITVVAVGSYGVYQATREISDKSHHPLFDGKQTLPEDIIAQYEAKNIFICLGLNDLTWMSTYNFLTYYANLINNIRAKSPDKNVVIMSVTPVVANQQLSKLTSTLIEATNNALLEFAQYNNIPFIDYAAAVRDSGNNLYDDLSSDNYCHLKIGAYNRLVEYMLYHPIKD